MTSTVEQELQNRIEAFAHDITEILKRAVNDSVSGALGAAPRRGPGRPRKNSSVLGPPSRRAGGRAVDAAELLKEIGRQGDRRMEELARSLRTTTKALSVPMKALISSKDVKTSGQARGTKYRVAK